VWLIFTLVANAIGRRVLGRSGGALK